MPDSNFKWLCIAGVIVVVAFVLAVSYEGYCKHQEKMESIRTGNPIPETKPAIQIQWNSEPVKEDTE